MNIPLKESRLSRFSREPIVDADGVVTVVNRPEDTDFEKFKVMARRRFLSIEWLAKLVSEHPKAVTRRLNILKRQPNVWVKVADEQIANQRAYLRTDLYYELDSRAVTYLDERGITIPKRKPVKNFTHQVMADQIMASFEIGAAEDPAIHLIPWAAILASENVPQRTRDLATPHHIPVKYTYKGEHFEKVVYADDHPFGIDRQKDGRSSFIFLRGPEADTGSEPIETADYSRSAIQNKFIADLEIIKQGLHRTHFGFPNLFMLYYFGSGRRKESAKRLLDKLTNGAGSKSILFATWPTLNSSQKAPADGRALTMAYERVGYPDFNLSA